MGAHPAKSARRNSGKSQNGARAQRFAPPRPCALRAVLSGWFCDGGSGGMSWQAFLSDRKPQTNHAANRLHGFVHTAPRPLDTHMEDMMQSNFVIQVVDTMLIPD
jgi:hypothetical protein